MNERIQELAKRARYESIVEKCHLEEISKGQITPNEYQDIYDKKFAELIVQECLEVLGKRFMGDLNREDMEVRRCIQAVQNHFDVDV